MSFGKGASMGLGIAGSLIAALMITGLGDATWKYIPWAWGVRAMGIVKGTTITLIADGADEKEAVGALVDLVKDNFGE